METIINRNESFYKVHTTKMQNEVIEGYKKFGRNTNRMLAKKMGWDINRITGRVNELVKLGVVVMDGSV